MTKGTTMVTHNVFRSTRLFGKGSCHMILFSLKLTTLVSYMTNHTTMVAGWNKLKSIQNLSLRPKQRFWLNSIFLHLLISFMWRNVHWFVLWGRTHNRHKIGYHNMIATNIFIIFRNRFNIKHLACSLRDSFSHFSSSTSFLDKTSLASKSIFNHLNPFSFLREFSASFLYFSTYLLVSLSLAIKSSFSQNNLLKFLLNFLAFFFKSLMLGISTTPKDSCNIAS